VFISAIYCNKSCVVLFITVCTGLVNTVICLEFLNGAYFKSAIWSNNYEKLLNSDHVHTVKFQMALVYTIMQSVASDYEALANKVEGYIAASQTRNWPNLFVCLYALSARTGPYDHLSRLFVRVSKYSSNFVAGVYSCHDRKWRSSYLLTPPKPLFCSRVPLRLSVVPASQL